VTLPINRFKAHDKHMMRPTARHTAVQVGEFVAGAAAAYVIVGATWASTGAVWAALLVAFALVAFAVGAEVRFGTRVTGLVAGLVPTAVATAVLLAALSAVLTRLASP
jgi:hypothetical protein